MITKKCDVCGKEIEVPANEDSPREIFLRFWITRLRGEPLPLAERTEGVFDICPDCLTKGKLRIQYVLDEEESHEREVKNAAECLDERVNREPEPSSQLKTFLKETTRKYGPLTETIGQRVKRIREVKGWTQVELRDKLFTSLWNIRALEGDESLIAQAAEVLDVTVDYLMTGKDAGT